jgi:hypothetical protein
VASFGEVRAMVRAMVLHRFTTSVLATGNISVLALVSPAAEVVIVLED